jgi:hypothetical protein
LKTPQTMLSLPQVFTHSICMVVFRHENDANIKNQAQGGC